MTESKENKRQDGIRLLLLRRRRPPAALSLCSRSSVSILWTEWPPPSSVSGSGRPTSRGRGRQCPERARVRPLL